MNEEFYNPNQNGNRNYYSYESYTLDDETRAKRRFSRFFVALLVYVLVSQLLANLTFIILGATLTPEQYTALTANQYFIWGLNVVVMYVIAFPIFFFIVKGMSHTPRVKRTIRIGEFLQIICVAQFFMTVGNIVGQLISSFFGIFTGGAAENDIDKLILNSPLWVIILVAVIIGPIVEELIFRKLLMDKLGTYGDRIAIIVSAIAFGAFHGNLYQFFYATMLGFVLAYLYHKTGNILYPIILHIIMNFIGSVLPMPVLKNMDKLEAILMQMQEGAPIDTAELMPIYAMLMLYSFIVYGLTIAGAFIFFRKRRTIYVSDRCEIQIPKHRAAGVILGNVGAILFIIVISLMFVFEIIEPLLIPAIQGGMTQGGTGI